MKTKMNRVDCSKFDPLYLYRYFYYNDNSAQTAEKKEIQRESDHNVNSNKSPKAGNQNLIQANSASSFLTKTDAAANIQNNLDPFTALEKMYSISANVKKQKQE